jgi:hypothetical protein
MGYESYRLRADISKVTAHRIEYGIRTRVHVVRVCSVVFAFCRVFPGIFGSEFSIAA